MKGRRIVTAKGVSRSGRVKHTRLLRAPRKARSFDQSRSYGRIRADGRASLRDLERGDVSC